MQLADILWKSRENPRKRCAAVKEDGAAGDIKWACENERNYKAAEPQQLWLGLVYALRHSKFCLWTGGHLTLHSIRESPFLASGFSYLIRYIRQQDSWSILSKFTSSPSLLAHVYHFRLHQQQHNLLLGCTVLLDKTAEQSLGLFQLLQNNDAQPLQNKAQQKSALAFISWHLVQHHSWFTALQMQFCFEEVYFYGLLRGLIDALQNSPVFFLSLAIYSITNATLILVKGCWILNCSDTSSFEPWCYFFWEYPNKEAALRGLQCPLCCTMGLGCVSGFSGGEGVPICKHPESPVGLWILQCR